MQQLDWPALSCLCLKSHNGTPLYCESNPPSSLRPCSTGALFSPSPASSASATRTSCCRCTLQPHSHLGGFAQALRGKLFPIVRVASSLSILDCPQNLTFSVRLIPILLLQRTSPSPRHSEISCPCPTFSLFHRTCIFILYHFHVLIHCLLSPPATRM